MKDSFTKTTHTAAPAPSVDHHRRDSCRACGQGSLRGFLRLGPTPLANSFLRSPEEFASERSYPLDVFYCETCSLVQLADVVNPEILFRDYIYVTGTSETIRNHNKEYARTVSDLLGLSGDDTVIEVASNNGSLLDCFRSLGINTLGIEPAENIAAIANANGIRTINKFFDSHTAAEIRDAYGTAAAVIGNNVLAHVDDPQDFLRGCKTLISPKGLVIIEVPYLKEFVESVEFDTVYHEHLCYFSVTSLLRLFENAGLSIIRVDQVPVHGGSLRVFAGHREAYPSHSSEVLEIAEEEASEGLTDLGTYNDFAERVAKLKENLVRLLRDLRSDGKSVAAYGAPAKGNTLLNYCGIDTSLIEFTVDKNALKVGSYTPGAHLPVLPVSELLARQPDFVLILAWNFADEIIAQQQEYRSRGGQFIIPIPEPRIV